jgi:hypothetical protein
MHNSFSKLQALLSIRGTAAATAHNQSPCKVLRLILQQLSVSSWACNRQTSLHSNNDAACTMLAQHASNMYVHVPVHCLLQQLLLRSWLHCPEKCFD